MSGPAFVYDPQLDGDADPGEIVWTWVPYEEDATKGKDRPTIVVARDGAEVLLVPLSSRSHEERPDHASWIALGSGAWDGEGRRELREHRACPAGGTGQHPARRRDPRA